MFKQRSFFSTVFSYYSFLQRFLYRIFSYYSFLLITAFFLLQLSSYYSFLLITAFFLLQVFITAGFLNNVHFLPAVAWFQLSEACFLRGNTPFFVR